MIILFLYSVLSSCDEGYMGIDDNECKCLNRNEIYNEKEDECDVVDNCGYLNYDETCHGCNCYSKFDENGNYFIFQKMQFQNYDSVYFLLKPKLQKRFILFFTKYSLFNSKLESIGN